MNEMLDFIISSGFRFLKSHSTYAGTRGQYSYFKAFGLTLRRKNRKPVRKSCREQEIFVA